MKWLYNIPFETIPQVFIEQLEERFYTYEEYLKQCPLLNELPDYWNLALMDNKDRVAVFVWGNFDPLEKSMQVVRITMLPEMFKVNGNFLQEVAERVKKFAQEMGFKRVYWITDRWEVFLRKLPNTAKLVEARVLEVINV